MDGYIAINKQAYDTTALEFQKKKALRDTSTHFLVDEFSRCFSESNATQTKILELGPGSGHAAHLLSKKGYQVSAIEFSEEMARLAAQTAPKARVIVGEFLEHDFRGETFDGIFAIAFIHLFSKEDTIRVLQKMRELLDPQGYAIVSTTEHESDDEGFFDKTNFTSTPRRFRRKYTQATFCSLLTEAGFVIRRFDTNDDPEVEGKRWMVAMVQVGASQ